jgi:hypothetical protein
MPRVMPNTFVEPANLKIQIAVGGDSEVNRFRIKIPGRSSIASLPITMSDLRALRRGSARRAATDREIVILVAQQPHEQQPPMISASQKPMCRWTAAGVKMKALRFPSLVE